MVDPISIGVVIAMLVKSAPGWFHALEDTMVGKGKEMLVDKGKAGIQKFLDEKKYRRNVELALQNAAERGLQHYTTLEERDIYRSVLQLLAQDGNGTLREEALRLFTLSDDPNLAKLNEKYQLSQRITDLATQHIAPQIDVTPYLQSFFSALLAEFYNDPLFRTQMSDVIKVRAATKGVQSLDEIVSSLHTIQGALVPDYTPTQFQDELCLYMNYIEEKLRYHKFAGIVFRGDEDKAPALQDIFVPLRISSQAIGAKSNDKSIDDLPTLIEQYPYLVMLGGPGSGKSTTTRYLTWSYARTNSAAGVGTSSAALSDQAMLLQGQCVPLRIELRLFSDSRRQLPGCSLLAYAADVLLKREDITVSPQMFVELLERRAMFLLFDGLDEVSSLSERQRLVEEIENFAQRYPGNRILVTSRPVGYEIASFTNPLFQHCQVQDFDDNQIQRFLQQWYKHVLKHDVLPYDIEQELALFYQTLVNNERLHKLAINPLLLTVMTALHRYERLPDERVLVYEKCADLLLDIWAKLKYEGTRWKEMKMGKRDQIACLAHLGFFLHQRSQEPLPEESAPEKINTASKQDTAVDVSERIIYREIKHFLADQNLLTGSEQSPEAERFLALVRMEAGLLVSRGTGEAGEQLYGFVHRTFQEYFAAMDVLERYQQESDLAIVNNFLSEHVHDPHWREVILLLLGKLPRKVVTTQLRRILNGANRRSKYADVVKQNLFFVCDCLVDGITVEIDFATNVVSEMSKLVKNSPFPSQVDDAFSRLGVLLRTRQYRDIGYQALIALTTEDASSDPTLRIEAAAIIYNNSPEDSDEQREGFKWLIAYGLQTDLPLEQLIWVAEALYENSPYDSNEKSEGARLLIAYAQQPDLSLDQLIRLAQAIYYNSPDGSDEQREAARLLIAYGQRTDLSLDQLIHVTNAIYSFSSSNSDEQEGLELLTTYAQRPDLSLDQLILIAQALYLNSPYESDEQREGTRLLTTYAQRPDLSLDQLILIAQALYTYSHNSDEQREGAWLLTTYEQRPDLSLDQLIRVAQAIYQNSLFDSDEKRLGLKLLRAYRQRDDLSLDQLIVIIQTIYRYSPLGSDEGRNALQTIWQMVSNPAVIFEGRLRLAMLPCTRYQDNFGERAESVRLLLTLTSPEVITKHLIEQWQSMPCEDLLPSGYEGILSDTHLVASIDFIYELACQEVVPTTARDTMYELLRAMVSLLVA